MRKYSPIRILLTLAVIFTIAGGCQVTEQDNLEPVLKDTKSSHQDSFALIPIARFVDGIPKLIKTQQNYWGFFQKNFHEQDPSKLVFHAGDRGVRLVKAYNVRIKTDQWQLAVEAYSDRRGSEVFMKIELEQDGNVLYLPNIEQNAFHIYFCDPEYSSEACELRVIPGGDIDGCFIPGTQNRCDNLMHRHLGI
jgi:hypothetical protein